MDEDIERKHYFKDYQETIYEFIKENNIDAVYSCNRNMFDDICEDVLNMYEYGLKTKIIKVTDNYRPAEYTYFSRNYDRTQYSENIQPFDYELNPFERYHMLYGWLIERCDYMLAYITDDADISLKIKTLAEQNGIKVLNISDALNKKNVIQLSDYY